MKGILVHLKTYSSSLLDTPDGVYALYLSHIVFFSMQEITMPAIF